MQDLKQQAHYVNEKDWNNIAEAFRLAEEAHGNQYRISGEAYIQHPLETAIILAELEMDAATIQAALLHDVAEDTDFALEALRARFGAEVANLVDGVTKLNKISYKTKMELQVENLRKMFLAMANDIRVILIKLADRLHNMRTLRYHTPNKQQSIAQETLEIYAPLANRLGIFQIKWELEDLSFKFMHPQEYFDLIEGISLKRQERERKVDEVISQLRERLEEVGVHADISGRPKHYYSIYRKMLHQNKDLSEIYDLTAIRVIVDSVNECYGVLGLIHTLWKPLPGRFKDYIAMPKPNLYQSLHTTVIGKAGEPFEIQIRTRAMHQTAEYGIAAHWKYKENAASQAGFEQKLAWLRQLLEWQHDSKDAGEFMEALQVDLFADTVFVFTPKGDVIELPADSCPIDFAYRVHTDVGHRCIGAKINGRIATFETKLQNGDIVEILTSKIPQGPSRDWVCMVKTSQAKNKIRQWFRKEKREEHIALGKEGVEKQAWKMGLSPETVLSTENMQRLAKHFSLNTVEDLYAVMGAGNITYTRVLLKLKEWLPQEEIRQAPEEIDFAKERTPGDASSIRVKGIDNVAVRFSKCCSPMPGDDVVGYTTRGRGVSIHRCTCPQAMALQTQEPERMVDVMWDGMGMAPGNRDALYPVDVHLEGREGPHLISDIMNVINETHIRLLGLTVHVDKAHMSQVYLRVEVRDLSHLGAILEKLRRVRDVVVAERV
ncbi:MAG: bifunctional (p)ppGpp synthetase/guanosine-3',5'-bis(diphosphate) 3'-pyrophosphohydrolase [Peptococcaceae bacterium]|nr:bifunctional (p)ppGpp synthetase/guanosine-3',5'-bis(diphosphate) 3'-pyrophosphohydrolase [Peptococcaceae bacterium]